MNNTYKPRRASKRWLDSDCPAGVLAIFDHPKFTDRYTVFYAETATYQGQVWVSYRAMSESPCSPQGVGLYGEMKAHDAAAYRYCSSHYAAKWSSLPEAVKDLVRRDLTPETEAA